MGTYGRFFPGRERYGGGTPPIQTFIKSLQNSRGTGYSREIDDVVYAENEAIARVLWSVQEQGKRISQQTTPKTLVDCIPRWEKILGLPKRTDLPDSIRRRKIQEIFDREGFEANQSAIAYLLQEKLSTIFVQCAPTTGSEVTQIVPDTTPAWPTGSPQTRNVGTSPYWNSSRSQILVNVKKPSNVNLNEFFDILSDIFRILDPVVPAYVGIDWYISAPNTNSETGPGFWLDESVDYSTFETSTVYFENDCIIPSTPNGYRYIVTVGGTSGAEPSWTTTIGGTNTTGSVTFRCLSELSDPFGEKLNNLDAYLFDE